MTGLDHASPRAEPGSDVTDRQAGDEAAAGALLALTDVITPYAVRVAATLRLADLISEGVRRVDELATRTSTNADALGRLLRYLACRGVFTQLGPGEYGMSQLAEPLRDDHPMGLRTWLDLDGAGRTWDLSFPHLLVSIRTGGAAYPSVFGRGFWEDLKAKPELADSFNLLMKLHSESFATDIAASYDWAEVDHVVDVGGGTGRLLSEVLRQHPHLRGTLVDLEQAVDEAKTTMAGAGVADRCTFVAGSFFDPLPSGANVYVLANILHDWDDADSVRILRRCADAAGEEGRVLLVERVVGDEDERNVTNADLRMLVLFGARERSLEQYGELATEAGLIALSSRFTPSGLSIVELIAE